MPHTDTCNAAQTTFAAALEAYKAKFPGHCATCGGTGGSWSAGSYTEQPDFSPCADCYEKGLCPGCGAAHDDVGSDGWACGACGWTEAGHGAPVEPECTCWLDEAEEEGEPEPAELTPEELEELLNQPDTYDGSRRTFRGPF